MLGVKLWPETKGLLCSSRPRSTMHCHLLPVTAACHVRFHILSLLRLLLAVAASGIVEERRRLQFGRTWKNQVLTFAMHPRWIKGDINDWPPLRRYSSHGCTGSVLRSRAWLLTSNWKQVLSLGLFMECWGAIWIFLSNTHTIFSLAINRFHAFCFDGEYLKLDSFLNFEEMS